MMCIVVFLYLGLFHDAIAHWIHARAEKIEAEAEMIRKGLKEEKDNA